MEWEPPQDFKQSPGQQGENKQIHLDLEKMIWTKALTQSLWYLTPCGAGMY